VTALPCPAQVTASQCAAANAFPVRPARHFPRATEPGRLLRQARLPGQRAQPCQHGFRLHELPRAQCLQHLASYNNSSLGTNGSYIFHERIFVANWDSTISSSAVNNLRFQWGRDLEVAGSNAAAPYVGISGLMTYGENYALPRTAEPDEHRIQISDTFSKVHGRHTFKAGFDVNFIHEVMINLYNGHRQLQLQRNGAAAFNNWIVDALRNQHRRRPDRQAL
jgi:hypothetical protein